MRASRRGSDGGPFRDSPDWELAFVAPRSDDAWRCLGTIVAALVGVCMLTLTVWVAASFFTRAVPIPALGIEPMAVARWFHGLLQLVAGLAISWLAFALALRSARDVFSPRSVVEGTVVRISRGHRPWIRLESGLRAHVVPALAADLGVGDSVRLELGAGSAPLLRMWRRSWTSRDVEARAYSRR